MARARDACHVAGVQPDCDKVFSRKAAVDKVQVQGNSSESIACGTTPLAEPLTGQRVINVKSKRSEEGSESSGSKRLKPTLILKVLYLFAGKERKSSVSGRLKAMAHRLGNGTAIEVEEWDILRGAEFDLGVPTVQAALLARIKNGDFDLVLSTPPCNTWSRVLFANSFGPCPVRSKAYPWGYPWLEGPNKARLECGNLLVKFTLEALELWQRSFPSALGIGRGSSASIQKTWGKSWTTSRGSMRQQVSGNCRRPGL